MKSALTDISQQLILNPKFAGVVGSTTAATSTFDLIQGGVSIFAIATGAFLSITLISIHLLRWHEDQREAKIRLKIDIESSKQLHERVALENKVLTLELKALKAKDK